MTDTGPLGTDEFRRRLTEIGKRAQDLGLDAVLVTPGTDLNYLTGYAALPLERLTCLVVSASDAPFLIVPELERPAALASPVSDLGIEVVAWAETDDPYAVISSRLGRPEALAVDNHMWAEKVISVQRAMPSATVGLADSAVSPMRQHKSSAEIAALTAAGAAIDAVHERLAEFLRPGRTEREVGADISAAILEAGHIAVDFVIVASGPNGASPHHDLSDRPIGIGEPIVIDIGGTMPSGYRSDCTRMYCIGEPPAEFVDYYGVLEAAQWEAVRAARPGMSGRDLDAVARDIITSAGFGEAFIHRTGHGIGLDTHEAPYIVGDNNEPLERGNVFSIEPGIYLPGRHGARIEDIVALTEDGPEPLNRRPRSLQIVLP